MATRDNGRTAHYARKTCTHCGATFKVQFIGWRILQNGVEQVTTQSELPTSTDFDGVEQVTPQSPSTNFVDAR